MSKIKQRVLSGIQPSGNLHLGNYFGMMSKMIGYQEKNDLFCFIADYHALTSNPSPKILSLNTFNAVCDFLALGLNPDKTTFWVQSDVPEVTELSWILSSQTSVGLMDRSTTYKDKIAKGLKSNMGLYSYPILMAADILLFNSNLVPVGKDQKQHIEMARDIAKRFNTHYGDVFILPEPVSLKRFLALDFVLILGILYLFLSCLFYLPFLGEMNIVILFRSNFGICSTLPISSRS